MKPAGPRPDPRARTDASLTRAMVLAAGLGTRMAPLTTLLPKPALPLLNRPIISHVLEHLARQGVTFAVVNSHALPERLEEAVSRSLPDGLAVAFSRERVILGTAGGLWKAARHFEGEPLYLVNSDSLTDADLSEAARAHRDSGRLATLIVKPHDPASGYRPVEVEPCDEPTERLGAVAGRRFSGALLRKRTFTGVHVLEPEVLEAIPARTACDINADIYPWLLEQDAGSVGTWLHEGFWFEAGSPARYLELNLIMLARAGLTDCVAEPAFIHDGAEVIRSVIGRGVRLGNEARLEECVLWNDVTVGEGVRLQRCIVTSGVVVPLIELVGTILMHDSKGILRMEPM